MTGDNGGTWTAHFVIGRLLCGRFRDLLKTLKFKGYRIDWLESSGWIERAFTVKCEQAAYDTIRDVVKDWDQ